MKVLVAEDDRTNRALLHGSLLKLGYEVVDSVDGASAWAALERTGARIIVSDWVMPDIDGLELCRRVRARKDAPYVYFILLTGKMLGADHFENAMAHGVDDFLRKPLDIDALHARLRVAKRIVQLSERVKTLEGILPMCAYCRHIRDSAGTYKSLEDYVADTTETQFSHGICPTCAKKHFKD